MAVAPEPEFAPITIDAVRPLGGGLEALVRVASPEWMRTSRAPGLADAALAALPGLARHRCESGSAHGIAAELADTETPHLVEHIALELLALAGWSRDTRGRTRWDFARDGRGVFRVWIGCRDERAVRSALDGAVAIATGLLGSRVCRDDVERWVMRIPRSEENRV